MAKTTADFMLERLTAWGVRTIYGFPGDGISSTLEALEKAIDRFAFVQARHEEEAAFMACAHAKWTGEPGVCLATSGPGAIHLLNGLYDAKLDHQPVVAIVGQQDRAALGGQLPAGGRPAHALQGRRARVRALLPVADADAPSDRPRLPHRQGKAVRHRDHPARRCRDGECRWNNRRMSMAPSIPESATRPSRAIAPGRGRSAPRRRHPQRGEEARDHGRRRRPRRGRGGQGRGRDSWAPGFARRCSARRCCPTTCPTSPARWACSAPARPTT